MMRKVLILIVLSMFVSASYGQKESHSYEKIEIDKIVDGKHVSWMDGSTDAYVYVDQTKMTGRITEPDQVYHLSNVRVVETTSLHREFKGLLRWTDSDTGEKFLRDVKFIFTERLMEIHYINGNGKWVCISYLNLEDGKT